MWLYKFLTSLLSKLLVFPANKSIWNVLYQAQRGRTSIFQCQVVLYIKITRYSFDSYSYDININLQKGSYYKKILIINLKWFRVLTFNYFFIYQSHCQSEFFFLKKWLFPMYTNSNYFLILKWHSCIWDPLQMTKYERMS